MQGSNSEQISQYRTAMVVGFIVLVIPAIFFDTSAQMMHVWNVNETFTHGYLIFPIALWLVWTKRRELSQIAIEPELKPLLLLVIVLVAWFLGRIVDVQVVQQIAMVAMIPIIVWMILGRQVLLSILFPLCYLIFAVPIGQSLIPPMMELTADFTVALIRFTGIPVFREGLYFSLPTGNWSVVEECSGVRYLIASIALGAIYAYLTYRSYLKRSLFMIFAMVLPIIANGLRAYGIVMIGHFSDMKLATGADHLVYGWVFFGIVIFIMFGIGSFWADPIAKSPAATNGDQVGERNIFAKSMAYTAVPAIVLIVLFKLSATMPTSTTKDGSYQLELPDAYAEWQSAEYLATGWNPIFFRPDASASKGYRFDNDMVQLDVAWFANQRQGTEAVSTQNRLTNPTGGDWKLTASSDQNQSGFYVNESQVRLGEQRVLIWKWYRIGDVLTPNPYIAKAMDAWNQIVEGRNDAAMITIATPIDQDIDSSRRRLEAFYPSAMPALYDNLEALRQ